MSMSEFEIPQRCSGCPNLCELGGQIRSVREHNAAGVQSALAIEDYSRDVLIGEYGLDKEQADAFLSNPDTVAAMAALRHDTAEWANVGDEIADGYADIAMTLINGCSGQLKMRATAPDGRVVTATVCGSSMLGNGSSHEGVHVTRELKRGWLDKLL